MRKTVLVLLVVLFYAIIFGMFVFFSTQNHDYSELVEVTPELDPVESGRHDYSELVEVTPGLDPVESGRPCLDSPFHFHFIFSGPPIDFNKVNFYDKLKCYEEPPRFCRCPLFRSMLKHNFSTGQVGINVRWDGWLTKLVEYEKVASRLPDDDIIAFFDTDHLIFCDEKVFKELFCSVGNPILIQSTKEDWPLNRWQDDKEVKKKHEQIINYLELPKPLYLSCGSFMGYAKELSIMLGDLIRRYKSAKIKDDQLQMHYLYTEMWEKYFNGTKKIEELPLVDYNELVYHNVHSYEYPQDYRFNAVDDCEIRKPTGWGKTCALHISGPNKSGNKWKNMYNDYFNKFLKENEY